MRPLLRANVEGATSQGPHRRLLHLRGPTVGGLLTPLGDPPLFLGFLEGVPFDWTLRLWPEWLLVNGLLIVAFNVLDQHLLLGRSGKSRKSACSRR
jgi:hypothetical protein